MKHLLLTILCLLFVGSPMFADDSTHINRGHNQIEIEGLQSITVSTVFEIPSKETIDVASLGNGTFFHVSRNPILTLSDFTNARVSDKDGSIRLELDLTHAGGKKIKEYSSKNVGKKLALIVNGKLLAAPEIKAPIDGKGISIDPVDREVAHKLVGLINGRSK